MINISNILNNLLKDSQKAFIKIKCGNFIFGYNDETDNPIDNLNVMECSVTRMASNMDYPLGSSCSCSADITLWDIPTGVRLKGLETQILIGYEVDGTVEWIPMGVYYPEKPVLSGKMMSFTAYDKMYSLSYPYIPRISGNHTPFSILKDIAGFARFELDASVEDMCKGAWGTIPVSLLYDVSDAVVSSAYNVNDCIGYVAGFIGANAHFNRSGKLQLYRFAENNNTITDDEANDVNVSEDNHFINYIYCNNGTQEFCEPENTVMSTTTGICLTNPLIQSQEQLKRIYNAVSDNGNAFLYRPITLRHLAANPAFECYDIVNYFDEDGNFYKIPIMSVKFIYDGSVVSDIASYGDSQEETFSSGGIISKVIAPIVNSQTKILAERIESASESIVNAVGGYVSNVDIDGDNIPDTFVASPYPVDLSKGSAWRTKGNCIRINHNGIGVSTSGADGPFTDFAVYYDKTKSKYYINANDIAVGTLQGIKAILEEGTIGGWNINSDSMYSDYGNYRAYIQIPKGADKWVFSTQKKSGDAYVGTFYVRANGELVCNNGATINTLSCTTGTITTLKGTLGTITTLKATTVYASNGVCIRADDNTYHLFYSNGYVCLGGGNHAIQLDSGDYAIHFYAGTSIQCHANLKLNFAAASGTVALAVNTSGVITTTSSSERYKENITAEIPDELNPNRLYDLPVQVYNYKDEYKDIELVAGIQIGITAENVEKYYPNALIRNAKGQPESWQERIMIPAMLKLIQEQKKELDELKENQDKQDKRITALEKLIADWRGDAM